MSELNPRSIEKKKKKKEHTRRGCSNDRSVLNSKGLNTRADETGERGRINKHGTIQKVTIYSH